MTGFACSKCGACCRLVGTHTAGRGLDRGDGVCKHLTPANLCAIYDDRPVECRVDLMRPPVVTDAYWHQQNHEACDRLHLQVYGQERA